MEGLKHGNQKSFDFNFNQPNIKNRSLNFNQISFIPKILICEKRNDYYFAENHIDMTSESDIPMEWCTILDYNKDSIIHPIFDNKPKQEIYFTITYQKTDLYFKKEFIKPSIEFISKVNSALEEIDPHSALIDIFFTFGNFFAQRVTLGHKLFKRIDKNWYEYIMKIKFNDYIGMNELQDLFKEVNYDNKGFLTVKDEIIKQENLKNWIELCKNDSNLQIIKYGDFVAIYEILEEPIRNEVKSILGIREHQYMRPREIYQEHLKLPKVKNQVIMTGCEKIQSSIVYHRITFPARLESSDFVLYGSLTDESGKQIDNVIIKFRLINYYGFSVIIENFTGHEMKYFGNQLNINWMLVGDPDMISYKSPYVQNYFVAKVGTKIINNKDLESLKVELPQPLKNIKNARFACTFHYPLSDDGPSFSACIESVDKKGIQLNIKDYKKTQSYLTSSSTFDEYKMHWCIYFIPIKKITIGQFIPINQSSEKDTKSKRSKSLKQVPGLKSNVYEAISAFRAILPWFDALNVMLEKISKAYDDAEYNRKTCCVLIDRADEVLTAVKILFRRKEEEEDKFLDDYYVKSFIKLHRVLRDIKEFINNVSQLKGLSKFLSADDIRKRCIILMNELESSCLELNLNTTTSVEDKRFIQKSLMGDVDTMTEFLETIKSGVTEHDAQYEKDEKDLQIPRTSKMPSKEIREWKQNDGCKVFKRLLDGKIKVACKRITIPDSELQMFNTRFAILNRLKESDKIIKFHGIAKYYDHYLVVFDWADCGNLKEVYERKNLENNEISWDDKVKIAHDICSGLIFLQGYNNYNAKLAKFDLSRHAKHISTKIKSIEEIIRWLAPEKMTSDAKPGKENYTFKCEVFSYGMLLWELSFQNVPYKDMEVIKICEYIKSGKREHLNFNENCHRCIATGFSKIIQMAWAHEPSERPCINVFNSEFNKLSLLLKNNDTDLDDELNLIMNNDIPSSIPSLEDGIKAHNKKNIDLAWECFSIHADLGDFIAKYWKGLYLKEGYYKNEKNLTEAIKLFKEAADENVPEAQLHYALEMKDIDEHEFIKYLKKSAANSNPVALFYYGVFSLDGKYNVNQDEKTGIQCLKLAAAKEQKQAIDELKKRNIDLDF
ncbi:17695_t:CDS:2, partial [Gigaspora margarita]